MKNLQQACSVLWIGVKFNKAVGEFPYTFKALRGAWPSAEDAAEADLGCYVMPLPAAYRGSDPLLVVFDRVTSAPSVVVGGAPRGFRYYVSRQRGYGYMCAGSGVWIGLPEPVNFMRVRPPWQLPERTPLGRPPATARRTQAPQRDR